MAAVLGDVMSVLECYDKGVCSGVKIDFGTGGLYYDRSQGPNWFNYYFEPVTIGNTSKAYFETDWPSKNGIPNLGDIANREQYASKITKYLKLKPEIAHEIDHFVATHFNNSFVIGIHYRGTDKDSEAPRVHYEKALAEVSKQAHLRNLQDYKIFVATDEHAFLEYMKTQHPGKILYNTDVQRSKNGKPLHLEQSSNQYENGKHALMDCILLSRTNLLIRTSSNFSLFSTYFNPKIPVIELNQRY